MTESRGLMAATPTASPHPRPKQYEYTRILPLSDGVFSIAMTLLVLSLHVPTSASAAALGEALDGPLLSYAISFAVIGRFWVIHHQFFDDLAHVTGRIVGLNFVFLALIAAIPFPTQYMGAHDDVPIGPTVYAVALALTTLASMMLYGLAGRWNLFTPEAQRLHSDQRDVLGILPIPLIFLLSIPIAFLVGPHAAQYSWIAMPFVTRLVARRMDRREEEGQGQ